MLIAVAQRLRTCTRAPNTLARLGGDEFAILTEQLRAADEAERAADSVVRALEPRFEVDGDTARISCSVGVALRRPGPAAVGDVLRRADVAMYAAKLAGKGRYVVAHDTPPATDTAGRTVTA